MKYFISRLSLVGVVAALASACGANDSSMPEVLTPAPAVVISEIMYHPVDENAAEDNHEFIELYNPADSPVELTGWQLTGGVKFAFPAGASIPAHGYKVIAKNRAALVMIASYGLTAAEVLGDYTGNLDNGGGTFNLVDGSNVTVDTVSYDDKFPWPIGADALGADDEWLGLLPNPIVAADHQYRGRSLERVAAAVPSSEISNWVPSPLDGASPGRPNSLAGAPPTIVLTRRVTWSGTELFVRAADTVKIGVTFSTLGTLRSPKLQYFVDNLELTGEPIQTVDLTLNNGVYEAALPPQPSNSIVRYRIQADKGQGVEVISPRPSDPFGWWAYFVTPQVATAAPVYQLFIKKSNWNKMYDNVNFATDDRRVIPVVAGATTTRCMPRPSWDATVPAVFIYNGIVYDTFVRYQGSRWNRTNGAALDVTKTTINPLPDQPAYRVLSWKIDFPDYAAFEGKRKKMVLNKLNQACPGLDDTLGQEIYGDPTIGIPVQRAKYARFHVNGGYYHYMLDIEHIDGDMMKRYNAPGELTGDLFKADGNGGPNTIEGPWGMSDEGKLALNPECPQWSLDDRYAYTYQRITNKWDTVGNLRTMIETVNSLRDAAVLSGDWTPVRSYFMATFDYQKLLDYIAIRNWAEPWDEAFHNHFLYRRLSDGKWLLFPQDKDLEFGEYFGWQAGKSFYIGEQGNPDNRGGTWNHIKDAFIKAFRTELWNRIVALDQNGVLSPTSYQAKVDVAAGAFSSADYAASPAAVSVCDFNTELAKLRGFGACRHQDIVEITNPPVCTTGSCGLTGAYYQTLAGDATHDFTKATLKLTRTDANVNFDFGSGPPAAALPSDGFQVRWTGMVTPRFTEQYTFYTQTDDGARLFVNGKQLVNKWVDMGATEWSGTISLTAGVPVTIMLEYYEASGGASAKLLWSSPSTCKQLIPTTQLSP